MANKFDDNSERSCVGESMRSLVEDLRNEKLYVENEKENIQALFDSVTNISRELVTNAWLLGRQSCILEALIEEQNSLSPEQCFQR